MHPHIRAQLEADRAAILAAIREADDPNAAHAAAMQAHQRAQEAWRNLAGDTLYTAGSTGGQRLAESFRAALSSDTGSKAKPRKPTPPADDTIPDYDPDDDDPDALTAWISAVQNALGDGAHGHTGDMLAAALAALLTSGGTPDDMAQSVNDLYDQWTGQGSGDSDYSAALAGDWTAMGWNAGETDAAGQVTDGSDVSVERTWTTVGDAKVRPEHADADGQTVGLDENFTVGGEQLMFPADPSGSPGNTYNCRCGISYNVSGGTAAEQDAALSDAEDSGAMSRRLSRLARKRRRDTYRRWMEDVL